MRKLILICGIIASALTMASCNKQEIVRSSPTESSQESIWKTPSGYLIPYSEKGNWKQYVKNNLELNKINKKYYKSQDCTLPNSNCNLECVETNKAGDCIKTSACAPCLNCC